MKPTIIRIAFDAEFKHRSVYERESWLKAWFDGHVLPVIKAMPDLRSVFGQDFARRQDLSVIWVCQQQQDLSLSTPLVIEIRNCPFDQQKQLLFAVCDHLPRWMAGALDANGNGASQAEAAVQRYGTGRIAEVDMSHAWYRDYMPRLIARIEDATLALPRDADVLADFRAIKKDKGVAKIPRDERQKGADKGTRHGDSAIAAALCVYAADVMEYSVIEYTPVPSKSSRWDSDDFDNDLPEYDQGCW
jgi:phage FluMu gp28-like protein